MEIRNKYILLERVIILLYDHSPEKLTKHYGKCKILRYYDPYQFCSHDKYIKTESTLTIDLIYSYVQNFIFEYSIK